MNNIVIALKLQAESQTRFTNEQTPFTTAVGTFIDSYGDDPAEYTLNVIQWKEAKFPKIGVYIGRIDITKRDGKKEVKLVVESVIPLAEYACINSISLAGVAGRDPEAKYFESGRNKTQFSLAVRKAKSSQDENADWFDLEFWGKTAETAANYVRKASKIAASGRLKFDSWNDRNTGEPRVKAVVVCDRLTLMDSKADREQQQSSDSTGWDEEF